MLYTLQNCKTKSDFIKSYRKMSDMTQEAFAEKCGVSLATVKNWENGRSAPRSADYETIFTEKDILDLYISEPWIDTVSIEISQYFTVGIISMAQSYMQCFPNPYDKVCAWKEEVYNLKRLRYEYYKERVDLCKKIISGLQREMVYAKEEYCICLTAHELELLPSILTHSLCYGSHVLPYVAGTTENASMVRVERCQIIYSVLYLSKQLSITLEMEDSDFVYWSADVDMGRLVLEYNVNILPRKEYREKYCMYSRES